MGSTRAVVVRRGGGRIYAEIVAATGWQTHASNTRAMACPVQDRSFNCSRFLWRRCSGRSRRWCWHCQHLPRHHGSRRAYPMLVFAWLGMKLNHTSSSGVPRLPGYPVAVANCEVVSAAERSAGSEPTSEVAPAISSFAGGAEATCDPDKPAGANTHSLLHSAHPVVQSSWRRQSRTCRVLVAQPLRRNRGVVKAQPFRPTVSLQHSGATEAFHRSIAEGIAFASLRITS
jgi:hypothetical protein